MDHTISLSDDGKYIILKVHGDINREIAYNQNLESHKMGRELAIDRFLVDLLESRNKETVIDNFEFAYSDMKDTELNKLARVALLVHPDDHSHDFFETVARNSGLDVTIFRDKEKAVQHLLK